MILQENNEIKFQCKDFVIVYKNGKTPTVPLKNQNDKKTLLGFTAEQFPEVLKVHGKNEWEGGALHRLDTATSGLVVFARTMDFYNYLSDLQKRGAFFKTYIAITAGNIIEDCVVSSYFRAFGMGRKFVKAEQNIEKSDNRTLYSTEIKKIDTNTYKCTITNGFRHQIRVHLASNGCPICGDKLYNPDVSEDFEEPMMLECVGVSWKNFTYSLEPLSKL